jgi:hypothetical protein
VVSGWPRADFELVRSHISIFIFLNAINECALHSCLFCLLNRKHEEVTTTLHQKFDDFIEIIDNQEFTPQLCKNVLIYQSDADAINKIREELEDAMKRRDHEANL